MRMRLGWISAVILFVCAYGGAAAEPIDCGPTPAVACLSAAVFSLAKTLPDDSYGRRQVDFAEQELASGDIKTALAYIVDENPDPSPWYDVYWIAQAGRFDRAIELAKQASSPVERLGGLLAVAAQMLDRHDQAVVQAKQANSPLERLGGLLSAATHMLDESDIARATRIVEDVEPQLSSIPDDDDYAYVLRNLAAEFWARLGRTERAAHLIGNAGDGSVRTLLDIARRYPAAASLREQAWREAERVDDLWGWQILFEDAQGRGDRPDVARAAQHVSQRMDTEIDQSHVYPAISLARLLMEAGFADLSARLVKQWPRWIEGKAPGWQAGTVNVLIPVLVGLGLDPDVELAANAVSDVFHHSQCLSKAAAEYFRIGRNDVALKFDAEALQTTSFTTSIPKLQADRDSALHNLALARADHGDIQGALDVVAQVHDERRVREVTFYVVRRAIDNGHGPDAGPAIEAMERQAAAAQDASLFLKAANYWYEVGEKEEARRGLAQVLKTAGERRSPLAWGDVAALTWRLNGDGKADAMLDIVDGLQVNDPGQIDHLVEIIRPVSPAAAVQLTGRQVEVESRIRELANIAIQIADAKK